MATEPARQQFDPGALLAGAPEDGFALLELRLDWPPDLDAFPRHRQLWLRCFVITRDPLGWIADRGEAWTAVAVDEDVLEVDLYLTLDAVRTAAGEAGGDLAAAVGRWATPLLAAALEREDELVSGDYATRAARGETPRLLAAAGAQRGAFGDPALQARREWAPLGLGALTDLVQHAFGPVELDRSPVRLEPVEPAEQGCPACEGKTFGYPTSLEEARATMCERHDAAARIVNTRRIAHARTSNPAGWRAIDKATARINGLPEPSFAPQPPRVVEPEPARNEPCPCGSGRKYKRCHGA